MGYKLNGVKTWGIPIDFVKRILTVLNVPYFIESGTAGGESFTAMLPLFKTCYTIELIKDRYKPTEETKANAYNGSSTEIIPKLLQYIPQQEFVLCWLDAHYSDGEPAKDDVVECPVMDELRALSQHQKSIILIDDARLFLGAAPYPLDPRKWPRIDEIFALCKQLFPNHRTTIMDDYVLCYPDEINGVVFDEWRERFNERYPNEETIKKMTIR